MRWRFVIVLAFFSDDLSSQILNIDKTDTTAYTSKSSWDGHLALGLEIDKQKNTLFDASNFIDVSFKKGKELFIVSYSNRFTFFAGNDLLNSGYGHLRWRHLYKNRLHPEAYIQEQWSAAIGMEHRFLYGANLRFTLLHNDKIEMTVATGVFNESEEWNYSATDITTPMDNVRSHKIKSNNYIKLESKPSKSTQLSTSIFYQAAFSDFFSPRIAMQASFDVPISRRLALAQRISGLYDVTPLVPIFNFYYSFSNSFVYRF